MVCLTCAKELKRHQNKFCSRSCAATFNNVLRVQTEATKEKIRNSLQVYYSNDANKASLHGWTAESRYKAKQAQALYYANREKYLPYESLGEASRKKILLREQLGKCNACGIDSWNDKPITLELEHKDGDHFNNLRENEELLCPNCHSQTKTFRGRNKHSNVGKITDEQLLVALQSTPNIRVALLTVGLAAKGANYRLCKKLLKSLINIRS